MISAIYIIFTLLLDFYCSYLIKSNYNNLTIFFPMLTIASLIVIKSLIKNNNVLLIVFFLLGIFYDLIYSFSFPINSILFLLIGFILNKYYAKKSFLFLIFFPLPL